MKHSGIRIRYQDGTTKALSQDELQRVREESERMLRVNSGKATAMYSDEYLTGSGSGGSGSDQPIDDTGGGGAGGGGE